MSPRLFDDQDALEPASRRTRADEGYLFGGDSGERAAPESGGSCHADAAEQPCRRRGPAPAQGTRAARHAPAWDEHDRHSGSGELFASDEPERPSRPRSAQAGNGQTRSDRRAAAQRRMGMRRRRSLVLLLVLLAVSAVGIDLNRGPGGVNLTGDPAAISSPQAVMPEPLVSPQAETPEPLVSPQAETPEPLVSSGSPAQSQAGEIPPTTRPAPAAAPARGAGTFTYAAGTSAVFGTAGRLRRYQVMVEKGAAQETAAFAAAVDATLSDTRSWIAGATVRFQRVPQGRSHDFVIYLATEVTSEKMCAVGGVETERYTSCRLPGQVIINLTRWLTAVPGYGAPIALYQQYVVNHEVGHQLGAGHEACGGKGRLAPVMQQQTLGLQGCRANAWPYVNGSRFAGKAVA